MDNAKSVRVVRRFGRIWFYVCGGYIIACTLVPVGKGGCLGLSVLGRWPAWIVLSMFFLLTAVFGRFGPYRKNEREHPVTRTGGYVFLYNASSFVGALAGGLAATGAANPLHYPLFVAAGSFLVNVLVWVILGPLVSAAETLLPSSRRHRAARLACARTMRRESHLAKERALAEVEATELKKLQRWSEALRPCARELASMAITGPTALEENRGRIIDIGIEAWQLGGVGCMRHLHAMAVDASKEEPRDTKSIEFIAPCWDGIGTW